jgi:A/G-specific adenine glycosylase
MTGAQLLLREAEAMGRTGRLKFPWRRRPTLFRTLLAEILLQHTPAERVANVYPAILKRWPTASHLSGAMRRELQRALAPLGLQRRRAECLHTLAKQLPTRRSTCTLSALLALRGVGRYTAGITLNVAADTPAPFVDGGMARLLNRFFGAPHEPRARSGPRRSQWDVVEALMVRANSTRFAAWGLVDLAREFCQTAPRCVVCPLSADCSYAREQKRETD